MRIKTNVDLRDYVELQRELGSLISIRDAIRSRYNGGGEHYDGEIGVSMYKARDWVLDAIVIVEQILEEMEPRLVGVRKEPN
jgi:hypothetical protein